MSDFKNYLNTFVFDTVLPGSGKTIKFKPITTGQLKNMLLYQDVEDAGKIELALDQLITECVVSEDFDINDLYLQDRFFLLVEIRKCSKGNVYSFQAKCGSCDSQTMINITLNNLIVNKLKPIFVDDDKPSVITVKRVKNNIKTDSEIVYLNPVIELENKLKLELTFPTRGMQQKVFSLFNDNKDLTETQKNVEMITYVQALSVKSIITPDGDVNNNFDDALFLLNNIRQMDQEKITTWFNDNDFGLEFSFKQKCPHCGIEAKREIPLEDFFF